MDAMIGASTIRLCRTWILGLAIATLIAGTETAAGEIQKRPLGPLQEAIYGFVVAEYCGLLSDEVIEGFYLLRAWIVARDGITLEQAQDDHVTASIAADYQYGDHGLGGFRGWCRADGVPAAYRFLIFREAVLGK